MGLYAQHGEELLIGMDYRLDAVGGIQSQLCTCLAEAGFILGGGEDGNIENLAWQPRSVSLLCGTRG
jgi:hypothetical protein